LHPSFLAFENVLYNYCLVNSTHISEEEEEKEKEEEVEGDE
jgi:hypothetical protein